jgi:hypothetical protein
MGFNTTVVVMNDSLGTIAKDKDFGKKLADAISSIGMYDKGATVDVSARSKLCTCCNAATVIETHHADHKTLIAVGGNMGEIVSNWAGSYTADKEEMLRNLADNMGYSLRKKRGK